MTDFQAASPHPAGGTFGARFAWLLTREMWASLAISVMWVVDLFVTLYGPNIETSDGAGTNTASVPSGVVIGLFAFLGTWAVARYAFRRTASP